LPGNRGRASRGLANCIRIEPSALAVGRRAYARKKKF
jgi:hypothetical protein